MSKRIFYIFLFIVLGVLVSMLLHAAIEIPMIYLLLKDFDRYGWGLTWQQWYVIHGIGAYVLLLAGVMIGYWQGKHWWGVLYDEKGNRKGYIESNKMN